MSILQAIKGIGGEPEIIRTLGGIGVLVYIFSVPSFVAWDVANGNDFPMVAFCTAYPAGLAAVLGAVSAAVSLKDRNVSTARVTGAQADAIDVTNAADTKAANDATPPPPIPTPAPASAAP